MKSEIQIRGISLGQKHMNSDADQWLRTRETLDRVDYGSSAVPVPERRKPLGTESQSDPEFTQEQTWEKLGPRLD